MELYCPLFLTEHEKVTAKRGYLLKTNHTDKSLCSSYICVMLFHLIKLCFFSLCCLQCPTLLLITLCSEISFMAALHPVSLSWFIQSYKTLDLSPTWPQIISFIFPKPEGIIIIKPFVSLTPLSLIQWTFSSVEIPSSFFFPTLYEVHILLIIVEF